MFIAVQMSGIYIHIPFCRKACSYCNFYFSLSLGNAEAFTNALCKEIRSAYSGQFLSEHPVRTVYMGGGTPSRLPAEMLVKIARALQESIPKRNIVEFTIEANPEDIRDCPDLLKIFRNEMGANRISLGIQSFHDSDLKYMGRSHSAKDALNVIELILKSDFRLSADLIYGVPGCTDQMWEQNVNTMINMNVPHLSAYALTVEPKTGLYNDINKKRVKPPEEDTAAGQFEILCTLLEAKGYEHYEISNACLPGHRSIHNSNYWEGLPYLGMGPSAHSFAGLIRRANVRNTLAYIEKIETSGYAVDFEEVLTENDRINEMIMLGLRRKEGVDLKKIPQNRRAEVLQELRGVPSEWYELKEDYLICTPAGKLFSDRIAAALFI